MTRRNKYIQEKKKILEDLYEAPMRSMMSCRNRTLR